MALILIYFYQFYQSILSRVLIYKQQELTVYLRRKHLLDGCVQLTELMRSYCGARVPRLAESLPQALPLSLSARQCLLCHPVNSGRGKEHCFSCAQAVGYASPPGGREKKCLFPPPPREKTEGAQGVHSLACGQRARNRGRKQLGKVLIQGS